MIWGAISRNFKSELVLIDGALTSRRYQDGILENHVQPLAEAAGAGRFMLVHDRACLDHHAKAHHRTTAGPLYAPGSEETYSSRMGQCENSRI